MSNQPNIGAPDPSAASAVSEEMRGTVTAESLLPAAPPTTSSPRTVTVAGERLRLSLIAAHRASINESLEGAYDPLSRSDAVWSYLTAMLARRYCGPRGQVISLVLNTWSPDGTVRNFWLTVGRPDPESGSGARWMSCRQVHITWREEEIDAAASALAAYESD